MITELEKQMIHVFCERYDINKYTIQDDGSVDVNGDVTLHSIKLKKIPFQFGVVSGSFKVNDNKLKSLVGSPNMVGGTFDCSENKLSNLVGGPKEVGWNYFCDDNELDTFYGMAKEIGNDIRCEYNFVDDEIIEYMENLDNDGLRKFLRFCEYYNVFTETEFSMEDFKILLEDLADGLE